jgi:hypothetical protein
MSSCGLASGVDRDRARRATARASGRIVHVAQLRFRRIGVWDALGPRRRDQPTGLGGIRRRLIQLACRSRREELATFALPAEVRSGSEIGMPVCAF